MRWTTSTLHRFTRTARRAATAVKKTFADFAICAQHGTEIWAFEIWCLNAVPCLCEEMLGKILKSWTELNWNGIINIALFWNSDDYFAQTQQRFNLFTQSDRSSFCTASLIQSLIYIFNRLLASLVIQVHLSQLAIFWRVYIKQRVSYKVLIDWLGTAAPRSAVKFRFFCFTRSLFSEYVAWRK